MKKLLLISTVLVLSACSKEWNCTTEFDFYIDTTHFKYDHQTTFTGDKKEMREYEDINTTPGAVTTCK